MRKEDLKQLLIEVADLTSDYSYIQFKAPDLLHQLQNVGRVPKGL